MGESQRINLLEREASLEEEELALKSFRPEWNMAFGASIGCLGCVAVIVAIFLVLAFAPLMQVGVPMKTLVIAFAVVMLFLAMWMLVSVIREKSKVDPRGAASGVVLTLELPVRRHWELDSCRGGHVSCVLESCDGLYVTADTRSRRVNSIVLPVAESGERAGFDYYWPFGSGMCKGVVLIAMRFSGDPIKRLNGESLEVPSSAFCLTPFGLPSTNIKQDPPQPPRCFDTSHLLFQLIHGPMREKLKPKIESCLRDEISLFDRPLA